MKMVKNWQKDLVLCLLLVLLVLLFLNRGARMEGVFFGADEIASDLVHFSYPYREFWATDYLKKGTVPLWNPYLGSGLPILAEAQTGIFYPVAIILYYFLPPTVAFNWLIISSFLLIATGTYFYCRKIGLGSGAAFLAAAVFSLSGSMVGHLRHVPIITTVAFMPWMFLATEGILDKGRLFWGVMLAFLTAFSFFGGHLTSTYLVLFVLIVYFFLRLGKVFEKEQGESLRPIILFGGALVLGVMMAMVQLLPSLELVQYSSRAQGAGENVPGVPFVWKYLLLFLNPYILGDPSRATWDMDKGNYWENLGYLGIVPLLLCLLAFFLPAGRQVFWRERRNQVGLALNISFILVLVLALGFLTPIYRFFLDWVPGAAFTRNSGRFLLFVDFFGSVLAGFGWQMLSQRLTNGRRQVLVLGFLILVAIADLFYFGYPFNSVMPLSYFSEPQSVKFLKEDQSLFRIYSDVWKYWKTTWQKAGGWRGNLLPYMAQREGLPPDLNLVYRLPSTSIIYALVGHFSVKKPEELEAFVTNTGFQEGKPRLAKLLGMENIKYFLSSKDINETPGLKLVKTVQTSDPELKVRIYENEKFLPRAYLVGKAISFANPGELLFKMVYGDFEPQKEVLLEDKAAAPQTSGEGEVKIESFLPTNVNITVNSKEGGFLVLSDTYYPGWKAYVDLPVGGETRIYQANYAYRAVQVPAGNHTVVFKYDPISYKIGKGISLGGLGFLVVVGLLFLRRKNEQKRS